MKRALLKMVELFIFLQCIDVQIKKSGDYIYSATAFLTVSSMCDYMLWRELWLASDFSISFRKQKIQADNGIEIITTGLINSLTPMEFIAHEIE